MNFSTVDTETKNKRMSICRGCTYSQITEINISEFVLKRFLTCGEFLVKTELTCGCSCSEKTRFKSEECPQKKWLAIN